MLLVKCKSERGSNGNSNGTPKTNGKGTRQGEIDLALNGHSLIVDAVDVNGREECAVYKCVLIWSVEMMRMRVRMTRSKIKVLAGKTHCHYSTKAWVCEADPRQRLF